MINSLTIKSAKAEEVVDITEKVQQVVRENKFNDGICILFVTHTTCALSTADLDPGTDKDMLDAFRGMIPKLDYRHPHDPSHVGDHILATQIGPSAVVPVKKGDLVLGTWQRVVMIEFNGPRKRDIVVSCIASSF
jgi:secondary thiamine-phosphate synthase enzyme